MNKIMLLKSIKSMRKYQFLFLSCLYFPIYMQRKKTSNHKLASTKLGWLQLAEVEPQWGMCVVYT